MIYWLKKLAWKVRKALGLHKKRIKTIDDIQAYNLKLFTVLIIIIFGIWGLILVGEAIAKLWGWFFPPVIRGPVTYL